jgi:hypothetical protein
MTRETNQRESNALRCPVRRSAGVVRPRFSTDGEPTDDGLPASALESSRFGGPACSMTHAGQCGSLRLPQVSPFERALGQARRVACTVMV